MCALVDEWRFSGATEPWQATAVGFDPLRCMAGSPGASLGGGEVSTQWLIVGVELRGWGNDLRTCKTGSTPMLVIAIMIK